MISQTAFLNLDSSIHNWLIKYAMLSSLTHSINSIPLIFKKSKIPFLQNKFIINHTKIIQSKVISKEITNKMQIIQFKGKSQRSLQIVKVDFPISLILLLCIIIFCGVNKTVKMQLMDNILVVRVIIFYILSFRIFNQKKNLTFFLQRNESVWNK